MDYTPDYEYSDAPCPKCANPTTHTRSCTECDDGTIDLYEEDAIVYQPGEFRFCRECRGTGTQHWCPNCGHDLHVKLSRVSNIEVKIEPP